MKTMATHRIRERDPEGRIVQHLRSVDTLERLYDSGAIDDVLLEAGRSFERSFRLAALDPLRAASMERVVGSGGLDSGDTRLEARRRVARALAALGGTASPAGSCTWHVLGLGETLRAWALGRGWRGHPVRQEAAQGILVAALGVIAAHYGLTCWERRRPENIRATRSDRTTLDDRQHEPEA